MRRRILFLASFICYSILLSQSYSIFKSDTDVLNYLALKHAFGNEKSKIILTFDSVGASYSTGSANYFNPKISIISDTRAVVEYQSINYPDKKASFIVDTKENVIMDKVDKSIYKHYVGEKSIQSTSSADPNYVGLNLLPNAKEVPDGFLGKFTQGNNYILIAKTPDKKGSISINYNGRKLNNLIFNRINGNRLYFGGTPALVTVFGLDNNHEVIQEVDILINYEGKENFHKDVTTKIRFRRK